MLNGDFLYVFLAVSNNFLLPHFKENIAGKNAG